MGGDSFPDTRRLSETEYVRVCEIISDCLRDQEVEFNIPVEVLDKSEICAARGKTEPYGDVDVIVARSKVDAKVVVDKVIETVGGDTEEIHVNDSTHSFLTRERYQVDLKFCNKENLTFLTAFKGNNDFGALLGHLLTPLHLKWSDSGLHLKLRKENISGVGAVKSDLLLSKHIPEICQFLGVPDYSLDCKTRLSCEQIFDILTSSRVFFLSDYDEKYKIRERRKKRPVSDTFFNYLESEDPEQLMKKKSVKYEDDKIVNILTSFRNKETTYDNFIMIIAGVFNKTDEVTEMLQKMEMKLQPVTLNPKFNHKVLSEWYPELSPNDLGKLFGKLKSKHSGDGPQSWSDWILNNDLEHIRDEAETVKITFLKKNMKES